MPTEKKAQVIEELEGIFSKCTVGILTDYRGLSTTELTEIRKKLREAGIDYRIVKNTLARLAAEKTGKEKLGDFLNGPVAIAFGYKDVALPAKVLSDHIRTTKSTLGIKSGFLASRVLTAEEVMSLITLPSREVLLAKFLGGLQGPIYGLLYCLTSPLRGLANVLQARTKQLEGENK